MDPGPGQTVIPEVAETSGSHLGPPSTPDHTDTPLHEPEQTQGSLPGATPAQSTGPTPPSTPDNPSPGSPTPNHPWTPQAPAPPDPRQPDDIRDAIPPQTPPPTKDIRTENTRTENTRTEPERPQANDVLHTSTASTELASQATSEAGSEVRSPTPTGNSGSAAPRRPGVSLARPEALTEQRPVPAGAGPHPAMPPGELPGPAVPAQHPRRGHRRTGKAAAVGIVAAGAAVAVVLAINPGALENGQAGSSPSPPSPSSSVSPTVEGTSRPQSLPPGSRREAGGFAWMPPEGWRRDAKTGSEVHYTSPDAEQELAAKSSLARDDLMDSWQKSEENAQQGQRYRKIRLERTTFRGHPAVVWEYTFTLQGDPWHAQLLGFTVDGKSYQINTWYRPHAEKEALKTYEKVRDSFTVL